MFFVLVFAKEVDYCVVPICRREITIHSAENVPLNLNMNMLKYCGGSGIDILEIGEIKELVSQGKPRKKTLS